MVKIHHFKSLFENLVFADGFAAPVMRVWHVRGRVYRIRILFYLISEFVMHPMLTIARRAAEEAGRVILQGWRQLDQLQVEEKGRGDLVSVVDRRSEDVIRKVLLEKYPDHAVLGEEFGETGNHGEFVWVVDPLDGTANFVHGLPQFAVSIALLKGGKPEVGVVYNPVSDDWFTAARGQGAQMNGRKIRVNALRDAGRAFVATGFPFKTPERLPQQLAYVQAMLEEFSDVRRLGSAALDLSYVACGRQDAYFEMGLKPWDMAAGLLIAQEAGAIVTDLNDAHTMLDSGEVACANVHLHRVLMRQLKKARIDG